MRPAAYAIFRAGRACVSAAAGACGKMLRLHELRRSRTMSKRARKRRARKKNAANHGRRPNA